MHKTKALFIPLLSLALHACNESVPYDMTANEIMYEAPQGAAESIEAAWHPRALLQSGEHAFYYTDAATREILELDVSTHQKRVVFDLSQYESSLPSSQRYDLDWGQALIHVDDDWIMTASSKNPLIWMNPTTGEVVLTGASNQTKGVLPGEGVRVGDLSFELFGGIARTSAGFYMIFGQQIYFAPWDGQNPRDLSDARIKLVAGSMTSSDSQSTDAREIALNLGNYTFMAELNGWLYFWSGVALKAVKNGKIYTITGNGFSSPDGTLEHFYAQRLPQDVPLIAHQGVLWSPYWIPSQGLLRIQVDAIDEQTGKVTGTLSDYLPEVSTLHAIAPYGDHILCTDRWAGNFWQIDSSTLETQKLYGPDSQDARRESLVSDAASPYMTEAILKPVSIQPLIEGAAALVYSPTLTQLSLLNLETNSTQLLMDSGIDHFATDHNRNGWLNVGRSLYIMNIQDNGNIDYLYASQFFKRPPVMGVPCQRPVFRLTDNPQLTATSNGLLLFAPNAHRVFEFHHSSDALSVVHEDGWYYPNEERPEFYPLGLQTDLITHWTANDAIELLTIESEHRSYLVAYNRSQTDILFANQTIPKGMLRILSGFKDASIEDGVSIESASANGIDALTVDGDQAVIAAGTRLYRTDSDGQYHIVQSPCATLPDVPEEIQILPHQITIAKIHGEIYACADNAVTLGKTTISSTWSKPDALLFGNCRNTPDMYVLTRPGEICVGQIDNADQTCEAIDIDPVSVACDYGYLFVSGQDHHIYRATTSSPGNLMPFMGMGTGLPDQAPIGTTTLGLDIGKMETDDRSNLYIWMRDTCTLWKLPNAQAIDEQSIVYRMITDDMLCDATAFTVTSDGMVSIIVNQQLYINKYFGFEKAGAIPGDVVDMTTVGQQIVIMTTDGLFVWNGNRIVQHAVHPIEIDGEIIHYATPSSYSHTIMQSPGEEAVIIPVFEKDMIIKIGI